jgi:hypothetical protein
VIVSGFYILAAGWPIILGLVALLDQLSHKDKEQDQ